MKKLQGASRFHLVMQFIIEIVLLILFSVIIVFCLLWFINPLLHSLTSFSINSSDFLTTKNLFILSGGLAAFIIISGIYPSIYLSSYNINSKQIGFANHIGIRNGLILFQNLVSITLICCTLMEQFILELMKAHCNLFYMIPKKDLNAM